MRPPTQRILLDAVVQSAVASNLGEEQGHGGDADPGQGGQGVADLPLNLVLGANTHSNTIAFKFREDPHSDFLLVSGKNVFIGLMGFDHKGAVKLTPG